MPKDGEGDLRGFEWHYWDRRAHKELGVSALPRFFGFGKFAADGGTLLGVIKPDDQSSMIRTEMAGMWESGTGRLMQEVETHDAQERKRIGFSGPLGFTPDGAAFHQTAREASEAGAAPQNVTYFWDAATGRQLHRITNLRPNASEPVLAGGKRLLWVTANSKEKVKPVLHARDVAAGKDIYHVDLPADEVAALDVSKDGATLALMFVLSEPRNHSLLRMWSVADGKPLVSCGPIEPSESSDAQPWVRLSPDGRRVAAGYRDMLTAQPMAIWDAASGKEVFRGQAKLRIEPVFNPDGGLMAFESVTSTIEVLETATGKLRHTFLGHSGGLWALAFNRDGTRLHSCGEDGTIRVWDVKRSESPDPIELSGVVRFPTNFATGDWSRFTTHAERRAGAANTTTTIAVWDRAGTRLATLEATLGHEVHSDMAHTTAMDQSGRRVAYAAEKGVFADGRDRPEGQLFVWDVARAKPLLSWVRWGGFHGCALSPDGIHVASVFNSESRDEAALIVWDVETDREVRRFDRPSSAGYTDSNIAFSPDGSRVVLYEHGPIRKADVLTSWDVRMGKGIWERSFPPLGQQAPLLVYSPDGRRIAWWHSALMGAPGAVEILDAETGKRVGALREGQVMNVRFSPDGRRIATSQQNGEIIIWDAESFRALVDLKRPGSEGLHVLTFTPEGTGYLRLRGTGRLSGSWRGMGAHEVVVISGEA